MKEHIEKRIKELQQYLRQLNEIPNNERDAFYYTDRTGTVARINELSLLMELITA
jgi:hypothetical protein